MLIILFYRQSKLKFIDFEKVRCDNIPLETLVFGFVYGFDEEKGIKIKHKQFNINIDPSKEELVIVLCDNMAAKSAYTESSKVAYYQDDTEHCIFDQQRNQCQITKILESAKKM